MKYSKKSVEFFLEFFIRYFSIDFNITMKEIKKVQNAILEDAEVVMEEKVAKVEKNIEKRQDQIDKMWYHQINPGTLKLELKYRLNISIFTLV